MIQSNKYYKSRDVGVTSEVGLLLTEIFQRSLSFCFCELQKLGISYTSLIPEFTWYEPLYNNVYKEELALNNLQWLIYHKTRLNLAQSAGTAEYTDCISAERLYSPNECPVYDTKQSDGEDSLILGSYHIGLNCVLMLRWIVRNRNVLTFKFRTYAKLNCLK